MEFSCTYFCDSSTLCNCDSMGGRMETSLLANHWTLFWPPTLGNSTSALAQKRQKRPHMQMTIPSRHFHFKIRHSCIINIPITLRSKLYFTVHCCYVSVIHSNSICLPSYLVQYSIHHICEKGVSFQLLWSG